MTRKHFLITILLLVALEGIVEPASRAQSHLLAFSIALALCSNFFCFAWYRHDRDERNYPRSLLLNMGIIAVVYIAMPYYLVRSRPRGQKLRALLRLAGFVLLMILSAVLGLVISKLAV